MQTHARTVTILYSFSSYVGSKKVQRDTTDMNLIETAHFVSTTQLKVPVKDRAGGFSGQSTSNGIGPVPFGCPAEASLTTTWKVKKDILGDRIRLVGGPAGGDAIDPSARRKPDDTEVVFLHTMSHEWYMDLVSSGCYKGVIDCTPGDGGGLGYACILQSMPILCIAFNETHAAYIKQHVTKCVFNAMMVASSPPWLFELGLVELKGTAQPEASATPAPEPAPKAPPAPPPPRPSTTTPPSPAAGSSTSPTSGTLEKLKQMLKDRQA